MSIASERKRERETLAAYSLMSLQEFASFLRVDEDTAKKKLLAGHLPWVNRGGSDGRPLYGVDPIDAAVYILAERENRTFDAYWEEHGEETVTKAKRYINRIRQLQAA